MSEKPREGSLEAPTRFPIAWQDEAFYDENALEQELERVFDICHGCRRCFSLCNAFPTLFDLVDESTTMEVDGVEKSDYKKVVDECYLCDMCYMSKCPYVPPHEWAVDFPHLMLRAKAVNHKKGLTKKRDKILSSTDAVGKLATIPVVVTAVNKANQSKMGRAALEKTLGVDRRAVLPSYYSKTLHKTVKQPTNVITKNAREIGRSRGKVALFATCYGNYNAPDIGHDLLSVFAHNEIPAKLADINVCCGMPKLELGDLDAVAELKAQTIPALIKEIDAGFDIIAPVPSCVLMFKQELPLMFPQDEAVKKVQAHIFDPFEYLMLRHKGGALNTEFAHRLGVVAYHVACHLRVQNMGLKTRDVLALIPETTVSVIERCSGHDGTYAVKKEFHDAAVKIGRPVASRVKAAEPRFFASDCPMAADHVAAIADCKQIHPISLLAYAYGLKELDEHND